MSSIKSIYGKSAKVKAELELNDKAVYLRGINEYERMEAPVSLLRGNLKVVVKSSLVNSIKTIQIRFLGFSSDVVYMKTPTYRSLREVERRTIIDDFHEFEFDPLDLMKSTYAFPFHFILEPDLPETIFTSLGHRRYCVEAKIIFEDNTEISTSKPVRILRCPIEGSLLFGECIQASGVWKEYMNYQVAISSKYMVLGEDFKINFKLSAGSGNKMCFIETIKFYIVQRLQCEKRSDYIGDDETFSFTNKYLLKYLKLERDESGLKSYEGDWTMKIPKALPFCIHPHLTNRQAEFENYKGLKVSHFIRIVLEVEPIEFVKRSNISSTSLISSLEPIKNDTPLSVESNDFVVNLSLKSDVFFKAPIRLLSPNALKQPAPPTYEEAIQETGTATNKLVFNPLKIVKRRVSKSDAYSPPAYHQ
ncbi:unnamed protein product [Wickerhamomyces anomalus]